MTIPNRIQPAILLAATMVVAATTSTSAQTVHSFNMGNGSPSVSGDVPAANNPNGLQISGETGTWADIWTGSPAATDDGVTLTFTPSDWGGTVGDARGNGVGTDALRNGTFLANEADIPWTLTGLTPNGLYDLVWYNKRDSPGENRAPNTGVTGFDAGNGVGASAPLDADKDQNFIGVQADGGGTISGTWFLAGGLDDITAVAGVQVVLTGGGTDTTPPVIASLAPANGSGGAATNTNLVATFNESVQKGTGNIVIKQSGGAIFETIPVAAVTVSGANVTIDPSSDFAVGTGYYVEIANGAIEDVAGNVFAGISGSTTWSFTTSAPDTTPPAIATLFPADGASDVVVSTALLVTFDEDVQKGSGDIRIRELVGGAIVDTIAVAATTVSGAGVTITPTVPLASSTGYYVEIDNGAIEDLAGNDFGGITGSATWSFTTAGSTPKPAVIASFNIGTNTVTGEVPATSNPNGLQISDAEGDWANISTGSASATNNGVTLTFTPSDWGSTIGDYRGNGVGTEALRIGTFLTTPADVPWTLTGLTPNGIYDMIWYNKRDFPGENRAPNTGVDGFDAGNGVGASAPHDADRDQNFVGVQADATGTISGTWFLAGGLDDITAVAGVQVAEIPPDEDGDGMPDPFELAHTTPPSTTALAPGDDLENGGLGDGLTNLQEYQYGTDPNDDDSDNDTLLDGAEVLGAGSRPATDPSEPDTDGDTLDDLVESNTGTWVSATTDTGTDPTLPDTDGDALEDGVETNTDNYVSASDTGTSPLDADSDGDNAEDWYEIAASFTDPTDAGDAPNIPYPLPSPDGSIGTTDTPVKVYIMSGQSNMVGFGRVAGSEAGTLQTMTNFENKFPNLIDGSGAWTIRNDVLYRGVISAIGDDYLQPGFGAGSTSFGPELGFGHVMGWYHDEPVLLIKSSIGNRSLGWDCLPPGSPAFVYNDTNYPAYGGYGTWPVEGSPPLTGGWYAGKQYDDYFLDESDMGPTAWAAGIDYPEGCQVRSNGTVYNCNTAHLSSAASEPGIGAQSSTYWTAHSVFNVVDILDNFAGEYPEFAAQGFEIAGFVWWQGHKDQGEPGASNYEANMVNFIKAVRDYYENRYPANTVPDAPFVLATIAFDGWNLSGAGLTVANAQLAVSGETGNHPEFAGNVKTMEARSYWRDSGPSGQGFHYNHHAETYLLTGDALGRGMVELLEGGATPASNLEITSITPVGGTLWELTLAGEAGTGYEFYSSTTLNFTPGTLVENLAQGDPGDPGTIGGANNSVVTTDGSGNATVRVTLTGDPADFVRAQAAP